MMQFSRQGDSARPVRRREMDVVLLDAAPQLSSSCCSVQDTAQASPPFSVGEMWGLSAAACMQQSEVFYASRAIVTDILTQVQSMLRSIANTDRMLSTHSKLREQARLLHALDRVMVESQQPSGPDEIHPHELKDMDFAGRANYCDICNETIGELPDTRGYRCAEGCDFDICLACKPTPAANVPDAAPALSNSDEANVLQQQLLLEVRYPDPWASSNQHDNMSGDPRTTSGELLEGAEPPFLGVSYPSHTCVQTPPSWQNCLPP